jgi:glyoxylase-like metal-dependent hydrolase (beta-lactamase superfamily II)
VAEVSHEDSLPEGVERIRAQNPGPLTLSGTNTYLLGSPAYVVDPGPADDGHLERVWELARERGGVAGIALTHRHLDHAGCAHSLRERSGAPLAAGLVPQADARPFTEPAAEGLEIDVLLGDGQRFGPLETIATPGHSPDHVSFLAGTTLFCGDTVLGEGSVFVAPGAGSLAAYLDSLRRLQTLELETICPGHGPVVSDPQRKLREYLEHRLDRERRLVDALERGLRTRDELLDDVWDDAPQVLRPAAALTLEAHLEKLDQEGRLPGGVQRLGDQPGGRG